MASILKRWPSFRRSSSQQSPASTEDAKVADTETVSSWTSEEAKTYITSLDVDELRRIVSDLAEAHSIIREALQKHAQNHPTSRPTLPHASHSMSKKRRAENYLDRTDDAVIAAAPTNSVAGKAISGSSETRPEELLPRAPVSNEEEGEKVVIEGQTGVVVLPADELKQAADGSAPGGSNGEAEPHVPSVKEKLEDADRQAACKCISFAVQSTSGLDD